MMAKIASLEGQLAAIPSQAAYELQIAELKYLLEEQALQFAKRSMLTWIKDIAVYLVLPLLLLLLAHWLIAVVYDTKMIYLRIISMIIPLPFAYFLFKGHSHKIFPWFVGVVFLAITSVVGMSWITSLVDHSPVWPRNLFEWKEVLEYSASIAFSFLTGMLLGGVAYANKKRSHQAGLMNAFIKAATASTHSVDGNVSIQSVLGLMKALQDHGGTVVAFGTTAVSIYTGLKGIIGS
jgi:hypothetical protein